MRIPANYYRFSCSFTFDFCKKNIEKFILLIRKGVMCYEYINSWNEFNEKLLPIKEFPIF